MKSLTYIISIFLTLTCYSQKGPGGIGNNDGLSNLDSWYIAENETTSNNTWTDLSGNSNDCTVRNGQSAPSLTSNSINGYKSFLFSNNQFQFTRTVSDNYTLICLFKTTQTGTGFRWWQGIGLIDSEYGGNSYNDFGMNFGSNNRVVNGLYDRNGGGNVSVYTANTGLNDGLPHIALSTRNATTGEFSVMVDESPFKTATNGGSLPRTTVRMTIGSLQTNKNYFLGDIPEVIVFSRELTTVEHIILNNYLSAKYDIPLLNNDFYTKDELANGNFDHNVAGIGQASDGTSHTDSQGLGAIRINNPSSLNTGDYLFWGEETKNATYNFITSTTDYKEYIDATWRVGKVNDLGTVQVNVDLTRINAYVNASCQPIQLMVDDNSDFSSPTIYDLSISGDYASASNVSFSDGDYFTLRYLDQIVWDGTIFFNGSGPLNAPDSTDQCLKLTVKPGAATSLIADAHVREVEVETGAILNISDGFLLEVEEEIVVNGTIDVLGESQVIQNHLNVSANSGTGEFKIRQQGITNLYSYNYWSAPVNRNGNWQIGYLEDENGVVNFTTATNADPSTTPITLSSRWLYDFNAISGQYSGWNFLSTRSPLTPGKGYTQKGSGASTTEQEYMFKGIPNDGNYSYSVTANNDFLIGNPYPSALNADQFITDNLSVIDGTLYFWEHFTTNNSHFLEEYEGGYATYNLMMALPAIADDSGLTSGNGSASKPTPTRNIPVGQGFFVTVDNSDFLVFNNKQRVFAKESTNASVFYRNENVENNTTITNDDRMKIWLSFKEPAEHTKVIGLGYDINASQNYDKGYDAIAFDDQRNDLYWTLEDKKLSIQALSSFNNTQEIPLGIKITDAGIYTFGTYQIENAPSNTSIYLKDNHNDIYYNLTNENISIWLEAVIDNTRFSIVFQESSTLGIDQESKDSIYIVHNHISDSIHIKGLQNSEIQELNIYNAIGKLVLNTSFSSQINVESFAEGMYILKIKTDKGIKNIKFIKS